MRRTSGTRWLPAVALACAVAAPVVVLAGAAYAAAVQPDGYDPVRQTFSALANRAATDRWIMGATLLVLGVGYLLVAVGLPSVPVVARVVLGIGGAGVAAAALFPQPAAGSSPWHMTSAAIGWAAFTAWPLVLARRRDRSRAGGAGDPPLPGRAAAWAVTGLLVVLMAWFGWELLGDGAHLGVAQRVLVVAQTLWPALIAVLLCRGRLPRGRRAAVHR